MRMEMHLSEYVLWMNQKKRKSNVTVLTPQPLPVRPAERQRFNFKTSMMNILLVATQPIKQLCCLQCIQKRKHKSDRLLTPSHSYSPAWRQDLKVRNGPISPWLTVETPHGIPH